MIQILATEMPRQPVQKIHLLERRVGRHEDTQRIAFGTQIVEQRFANGG